MNEIETEIEIETGIRIRPQHTRALPCFSIECNTFCNRFSLLSVSRTGDQPVVAFPNNIKRPHSLSLCLLKSFKAFFLSSVVVVSLSLTKKKKKRDRITGMKE